MLALIVFLFAFTVAQDKQGPIVCNLCIDTCEKLKELAETKGIETAREYLENLCSGVSGFLGSLCKGVVNFGMDEILKLIENRVEPEKICQNIGIC